MHAFFTQIESFVKLNTQMIALILCKFVTACSVSVWHYNVFMHTVCWFSFSNIKFYYGGSGEEEGRLDDIIIYTELHNFIVETKIGSV